MPSEHLRSLAHRVEDLPPDEQLILAARLLKEREPILAHAIASKTVEELGAWIALMRLEGKL